MNAFSLASLMPVVAANAFAVPFPSPNAHTGRRQ